MKLVRYTSSVLTCLLAVAVAGCTIPMRNGSGIRLAVEMVPASQMAENVSPTQDTIEGIIAAALQMYITSMDPVTGGVLEYLLFGPLRDNRADRSEARSTTEAETEAEAEATEEK